MIYHNISVLRRVYKHEYLVKFQSWFCSKLPRNCKKTHNLTGFISSFISSENNKLPKPRSTEVVKSAKKTFVILLPFGVTNDISEVLQWTGTPIHISGQGTRLVFPLDNLRLPFNFYSILICILDFQQKYIFFGC